MEQELAVSLPIKIILDVCIVVTITLCASIGSSLGLAGLLWLCQPGEPERRLTVSTRKRQIKIFTPIVCIGCTFFVGVLTTLLVWILNPLLIVYLVYNNMASSS